MGNKFIKQQSPTSRSKKWGLSDQSISVSIFSVRLKRIVLYIYYEFACLNGFSTASQALLDCGLMLLLHSKFCQGINWVINRGLPIGWKAPLAAIFPGSIFGYSSGLNSLQSGYQIVCAGDLNDFWKIKLKGCGALSRYKANGFHIAFSFTSFNRVFLRHVSALDKLTAKNTGSGFSNNWH